MTMLERITGVLERARVAGGWIDEDVARAVLTEIREPTEAMQVAGHNVRNDPTTGQPTACGTDEIYTAMIDAAVAEGPTPE